MAGPNLSSPYPIPDTQHDRAALRGNPSFVWRAGQERRLGMILAYAPARLERVLVDGCGVGMYVRALQEHAAEVHGLDIEGEHLLGAVDNAPGAGDVPWPVAQKEAQGVPAGIPHDGFAFEIHVQQGGGVVPPLVGLAQGLRGQRAGVGRQMGNGSVHCPAPVR